MVLKKEDKLDDILTKCRNFLRGKLDFVENRNAVLILVFLKFAQNKFIIRQHEIIKNCGIEELDNTELYSRVNVLYIVHEASWSNIVQNMYSEEIAKIIDNALNYIENQNPVMKDVFPPNFFVSLNIEPKLLSAFIECVDMISEDQTDSEDLIGRVYEFFITHFAMDERKIKGEYFTPRSIVDLMVELIEPYSGIIYDPCCGTGGLFVQSAKLSDRIKFGEHKIELYGQENNREIWRLAKLNLALRGIQADLGNKCISTFTEDIHPAVKADFILANPPFNLRSWQGEVNFETDKRFCEYNLSQSSNANYAWILHILSKLKSTGVAGIILSNSPLNNEEDYQTRKKLVDDDKIEAIIVLPREMFYSTDISVTLWIINNNKGRRVDNNKIYAERKNQVLFIDLRSWVQVRLEGNYIGFNHEQIQNVKEIFHSWRFENPTTPYQDAVELCKSVSIKEIKEKNYNLAPSKYIDFEYKNTDIDYRKEITQLIADIKTLKQEEDSAYESLKETIESISYDLEKN